MARTAAVVACLLAFSGPADGRNELTVTFIGNMGVHVTDGRVAILTDFPYDAQGRFMPWSAEHVPAMGRRTLCVITHSHRDHFARELAPRFCGQLLGPKDAVEGTGVDTVALSSEVRWNGVTIRPVATPHANLEHYSYVIEWHGVRLFFTGDTEDSRELLAAGALDAAFVSPWLLQALQKRGVRLDARRIVTYHHDAVDAVPDFQGRRVPARGEVLTIASN